MVQIFGAVSVSCETAVKVIIAECPRELLYSFHYFLNIRRLIKENAMQQN